MKQLENIGMRYDEPMSKHSTFLAGGKARYFVSPKNVDELRMSIECARKNGVAYYVIGRGSNILVSDKGYDGLIIHIGNDFANIVMDNGRLYAAAGALLSAVAIEAINCAILGFEGLAGIPGSIGGAVAMNAGAYGYDLSQILDSVDILDEDLSEKTLRLDELELGYRHSIFSDTEKIVIGASFIARIGNKDEIRLRTEEFKEKRKASQPLNYGSAGSTFKRPEGYYAGQLIESANLKGVCVGDAQVSMKHAGFIVNKGNACASEIYELICYVTAQVYAVHGVRLEPEVRLIGEFDDCNDMDC